jgi:glyoxylase-like metal-dependent hydrolase (beta-lactamase superfamily II)
MSGSGWYQVVRYRDGISWIQEPLVKSFLVEGERDVAVLDTGMGFVDFAPIVAAASDRDPLVLQTHAHWDHMGSSASFRRVLVHPAEADWLRAGTAREQFAPNIRRFAHLGFPKGFDPDTAAIRGVEPTGELREGDRVDLGGRVLEAYHTPGHSPGGMSFLDRAARALFTGDLVNPTRALLCLPGSSPADYRRSLARVVELAEHADDVFVGHGDPMTPAAVRAIYDAYESIWSGEVTGERDSVDLGWVQRPCDAYEAGGVTFLLTPGAVASTS